jgi:predicted component of type VI protein secretion system
MRTFRLKGASGAVINQSFTLGGRTVIGRADDCDLRLDQPGVAPRHAAIMLEGDGRLQLQALAPGAEILLNGEAVQESPLASGDEIRIANCRFVVQAPGLRPDKVLTPAATRPRRSYLPWLIVGGLLAAAAGAWYAGLLDFGWP